MNMRVSDDRIVYQIEQEILTICWSGLAIAGKFTVKFLICKVREDNPQQY